MRADDDRYGWLDEETAERLLRDRAAGDPPPADAEAPQALTALESVLDELAASTPLATPAPEPLAGSDSASPSSGSGSAAASSGSAAVPSSGSASTSPPGAHVGAELPGEAAALAAFRAARVRAGAAPADGAAHSRPGRRAYPRRFGRPLRLGIATLATGVVLGGVAVGAGGVLPAPFGGGDDPPPSAAPTGPGSDGVDGRTPDGGDGPSAGTESDGDPTGERSDGPHERGRDPGDSDASTESDAPAGSGDFTGPGADTGEGGEAGGFGSEGRDESDGRGSDGPERPDGALAASEARIAALCGERGRNGLDRAERMELERLAGGPDEADRLCRRVTGGEDPSGGRSPAAPTGPAAPTDPAAPGRPSGGGEGGEGGDVLPGEGGDALPVDPPPAGPGGAGGGADSGPSGGANSGSVGGSVGGSGDDAGAPPAPPVPEVVSPAVGASPGGRGRPGAR
ncbi:hypothetical protein F0L17_16590 [Streptomyces sp. TRM43335]|uniref:Uncharacterized protein n=1 Tax=Streptomyces taklimakanensis TaxID=2569853 RepID=A0A6G2BEL3_9ACTN|nr:hypothetical protein [Streptomyces taklimakanensis]MTE20698.1 hypothetical protein [Streptomyces taklimakanensis]